MKKYIQTPTQALRNATSISKVFKDAVLRFIYLFILGGRGGRFETEAFMRDGVFMCAHVWRCCDSPAFSVDEHPEGTLMIDSVETF